jgi:hypothetical protein
MKRCFSGILDFFLLPDSLSLREHLICSGLHRAISFADAFDPESSHDIRRYSFGTASKNEFTAGFNFPEKLFLNICLK